MYERDDTTESRVGEGQQASQKRGSMSAFYGIKETADVSDFAFVRPYSSESTSSSANSEMCRICLEGRRAGFLARPCRCKGTSAFVHLPCLKEWLLKSNSSRCELCRYKFKTKRRWKPLKEWVLFNLSPENSTYLKIILVIIVLLLLFTLAGVYLCSDVGTLHGPTIKQKDVPAWKVMSISVLSLCSGALYVIGCLYCCCHCGGVWREWTAKNQTMTILLPRRVITAWTDPGQYFTVYSEMKRPREQKQSTWQALTEETPQGSLGNDDVTRAEIPQGSLGNDDVTRVEENQDGDRPGSTTSMTVSGSAYGWARVPRPSFITRSNTSNRNFLSRYFRGNRSPSVTPELTEVDDVTSDHEISRIDLTEGLIEIGIL
ncbi:PREDICTED: E3 ubiquitin-protein ligase MARCH8-like [Branchiostoma belcheri]|uniref:E3 ubiquitin-protein ligase MARCH8-like n=1 Tax=Branchiostoma belcheri TaxID=7741 RepID=A0A6P5ALV6_BRABE|nr:PREDICTED: E3 ubiquitin-protein ligase MARCH8-like [Branchiostoma belcheri]